MYRRTLKLTISAARYIDLGSYRQMGRPNKRQRLADERRKLGDGGRFGASTSAVVTPDRIESADDILKDESGAEITLAEYYENETALPELDERGEGEDEDEDVICTESLNNLESRVDAARKYFQHHARGYSQRSLERQKQKERLLAKSANAPGQKSILSYVRRVEQIDEPDTDDEMHGASGNTAKDEKAAIRYVFGPVEAIVHLEKNEATKLNLSDGGAKVPLMRSGWYYVKDESGQDIRVVQEMQNSSGVQKGMRTILTERGKFLNDQGHPLCKVCRSCLEKTPHEERENKTQKCCAFYVLSQEPDFKEQKPWLQEAVERHGFQILFYPKYHCELNWIEMIWGWVKSYHRRHCTYSFADLDGENGLTRTLDERIPISFVRKTARHCLRYMHFYRIGLEGQELEFAVKKYKSHRDISSDQRDMIREAFDEYCKKNK
jgi:hypothetical protein